MGMDIDLTPQFAEMVRQKVSSSLYVSASEVVHEAWRLMAEKDELRDAKLERLRASVHEGLNSGPSTAWDPDEIKRAGRAMRTVKTTAGG